MKYLFVLLVASVCFVSCAENNANEPTAKTGGSQAATTDNTKLTTIEWVDSIQQNLGTINEGVTPEITWRFKNTGSNPLVIENASATCGCTIAEKPEKPLMPGEEGVIKAKFNSNGRLGPNNKNVIVLANTDGTKTHELTFNVTVEKK